MKDVFQYLKDNSSKTLMVVFPHPDDETMATGGLLLAAKRAGWKTVVVTLTKGGAGQIHTPINGFTLKEVRFGELTKATRILSVDQLVVNDFDDGKLKEQRTIWQKILRSVLDQWKPDLVVTYDPSGISGHPDHIVLSLELKKLVKTKLWWVTVSKTLAPKVVNPLVKDFQTSPDWQLDLGNLWLKKWWAARSHRSQSLGKGLPIPLSLALAIYHYEWYHEVDLQKDYPFKFIDFKI